MKICTRCHKPTVKPDSYKVTCNGCRTGVMIKRIIIKSLKPSGQCSVPHCNKPSEEGNKRCTFHRLQGREDRRKWRERQGKLIK